MKYDSAAAGESEHRDFTAAPLRELGSPMFSAMLIGMAFSAHFT